MRIFEVLSYVIANHACLASAATAVLAAKNVIANGPAPNSLRTVGYFGNWAIYERDFKPQDLVASQFSHILYAFADVAPNGTVSLSDPWSDVEKHFDDDDRNDLKAGLNAYGCIKQLFLQKIANRKMKVLLSVGGWTFSTAFTHAAATDAARQNFAESAVAIIKDVGFDGLDIDWEYASDDAQAADFVLLLEATRSALDAYSAAHANSYHFILTAASSAGPDNYERLRLADMDRYLDFWNLMAYDYSGSWSSKAGLLANLYNSTTIPDSTNFNTDRAVDDYIAAGVPADKIVLGMPLYGRSFAQTAGPGSPFTGVGMADAVNSWEAGVWDYKSLPRPGASEYTDDSAVGSWSYDKATEFMISYDSPAIAQMKANYIKEKGLGGGMWWETSADGKDDRSLIKTVVNVFGGESNLECSENLLEYPESIFQNIKAGMI